MTRLRHEAAVAPTMTAFLRSVGSQFGVGKREVASIAMQALTGLINSADVVVIWRWDFEGSGSGLSDGTVDKLLMPLRGVTMNLTKRNLISDELERDEYDRLVTLALRSRDEKWSPSHAFGVRKMVWERMASLRELSARDQPPPELVVDPALMPWSKIREKAANGAAAYEELLSNITPHPGNE